MKRLFSVMIVMAVLTAWIQYGFAQTASENEQVPRSMAVVLKFTGKNGIPEQMQLFSKHVFQGQVRNLQTNPGSNYSDLYRLKILNEKEELIYADVIGNPLVQNMESYNPEGTMERNDVQAETGYANVRFEIEDHLKSIKVVLYKINGDAESVIATINISIL
jgi:hypothetical protein